MGIQVTKQDISLGAGFIFLFIYFFNREKKVILVDAYQDCR